MPREPPVTSARQGDEATISPKEQVQPMPGKPLLVPKLAGYLAAATIAYVYAVTWQWTSGEWLFNQLVPLPDVILTSPIPVGYSGDINFWFGQFLGVIVICLATHFSIRNESLWKTHILPLVFHPGHVNIVSSLFLQQLQGVVFVFTSQQLVMLCSWFFMPPGANTIKGARITSVDPAEDLNPFTESLRKFMDARLCFALYLSAALTWFATRIGLVRFGGPGVGGITSHTLRDSTSSVTETSAANHASNRLTAALFSKRTIQFLFYMAVGIMRLYPALNAAGLDFGTALILIFTRYPVTVLVLGTLAVFPSTFLGCKIKESMGLSLDSIVLVNLCNVLAVLWSAQAGRKLAFYVIDVAIATDPVQAAITTTIRLIIVLVFGIVAVGCGYALYTLYLSSPVFLCEFGQPVFLGVHIHGLTEVRSQMWKAYDKYFRGLVTELQPNLPSLSRQSTGDILANSTPSLQSVNPSSTSGHVSFISVLKDVLGMYVSLRNMFAAQDRLTIAAKFSVQVANTEAKRPLTLAGVRVVVTARKKRQQPAQSGGKLSLFMEPPSPMLQLVSLVFNSVNIPAGVSTVEMEAQIQVGTEALVTLAKDVAPIEALDVVLCVDSPMIDQVCFTMPLVSYQDGRWQHCFQADDGSVALTRWANDRERLQKASDSIRNMLAGWRRRPINEMGALTSDAEGLLAILERINPRQQSQPATSSSPKVPAASVDDLLQAAHFLVSIRLQEEQMCSGSADHRLSTACLLETGNAIMNLFYDAVLVDRLGGSHPIHTIIMSAIMAALQGLLSSDSPFSTQPPETTPSVGLPVFPVVPQSESNGDGEDPSPPTPPAPTAHPPSEDPTIPDPVATDNHEGLDPLSVMAQQDSFSGHSSSGSNVFASGSTIRGLLSNNRFAYMRPATESNDLATVFRASDPVPKSSAIGMLFESNAFSPSPSAPPSSNYYSCRGGEASEGFVMLGAEDVHSLQETGVDLSIGNGLADKGSPDPQ